MSSEVFSPLSLNARGQAAWCDDGAGVTNTVTLWMILSMWKTQANIHGKRIWNGSAWGVGGVGGVTGFVSTVPSVIDCVNVS